MQAEIISIGDELLIGQVINTNAARIGEMLNLAGIRVKRTTVVADDRDAILNSFDAAFTGADLVLVTGGLGPTKDDITKKILCEFFRSKLLVNEDVLKDVTEIFARRGKEISEVNKKQAEVPDNCTVIRNKNGTAPGMWFERDGKILVSMPGVPYETMAMMEEFVIPKLKAEHQLQAIFHYSILTQGIGESYLAETIEEWEDSLAAHNIKLAYLPSVGAVRLRLSGYGENNEAVKKSVMKKVEEVLPLIKKYVYGFEEYGKPQPKIESVLGELLLGKKKRIALAESCTGGYISHLITSVAGSSKYFNGCVVPYHNEFKHALLEVDRKVFTTSGAVSEECVQAMATGVAKKFKADYAIAVSGIAGPAGGTPEKPVGTVWMAWANGKEVKTEKFVFGTDRGRNIHLAAITAMNRLRILIEEGF
jgi:nicotinamide-nucleotide amidase